MANEGPSLTKATYDKKRPRSPPPSPARVEAENELAKREAAKSRSVHKEINRVGLAQWFLDRIRK
jgi:hypothetical protein